MLGEKSAEYLHEEAKKVDPGQWYVEKVSSSGVLHFILMMICFCTFVLIFDNILRPYSYSGRQGFFFTVISKEIE